MNPIYDLRTPRSELGKASKATIYLVKALTGVIIAGALGLLPGMALTSVLVASSAVFVTSKVCWYLNKKTRPKLDDVPDWICDGVLHLVWLPFVTPGIIGLVFVAGFLATYPYSHE